MAAIRGVYEGKDIKPLSTELLPAVDYEIPIAITFLEEPSDSCEGRQHQTQIAIRMRASRQAMIVFSESGSVSSNSAS
ncbi:MAG: hypothetical protein DMF61_24300 [Blastocatellia bacterium AA13]|nr:MAG: hypothetical protein DMF61_24300 [Blastocatellia bacterium AA13]